MPKQTSTKVHLPSEAHMPTFAFNQQLHFAVWLVICNSARTAQVSLLLSSFWNGHLTKTTKSVNHLQVSLILDQLRTSFFCQRPINQSINQSITVIY